MTYEQIKHLKQEEFIRVCGVRAETFAQMVAGLQNCQQQQRLL